MIDSPVRTIWIVCLLCLCLTAAGWSAENKGVQYRKDALTGMEHRSPPSDCR